MRRGISHNHFSVYSFMPYIFTEYYVPSTILGIRDTAENMKDEVPDCLKGISSGLRKR